MAAPFLQHLAPCITCHAWNSDKTEVAICPNNNQLQIYSVKGEEGYTLIHTLTSHDQVITSVDWSPIGNRIVTCSQDRNAYVWTFAEKEWKPTLVILRINRAATHVKWSPNGKKFAVASGSKLVSICYFEEEQDWWVSKHIKKHTSTVLSVAWHPSNLLLATGSSDFKCRIVYAGVRGVDQRAMTPFGEKVSFGAVLAEFTAGTSWVHSVAWSPSGDRLVYVGHNSSINFVNDVTAKDAGVQKVLIGDLPYRVVTFLSDDTVVAAGHDCNPTLYAFAGGSWSSKGKIDTKQKASNATRTATQSAFQAFQSTASKGTADSVDYTLDTKHQNAISAIQLWKNASGAVEAFTTSGVDGNLVVWTVKSVEETFAGLHIA